MSGMARFGPLYVSMTETREFRRLVGFLADIEKVAEIRNDTLLKALVIECRRDLVDAKKPEGDG